jgi:hypothetical protein
MRHGSIHRRRKAAIPMNATARGCGLNISSDGLPGSRRKRLTRATGTQTAVNL